MTFLVRATGDRSVVLNLRPSQAGAAPAAGEYYIHLPVKDPIYGTVAPMTPATSSSGACVATAYQASRATPGLTSPGLDQGSFTPVQCGRHGCWRQEGETLTERRPTYLSSERQADSGAQQYRCYSRTCESDGRFAVRGRSFGDSVLEVQLRANRSA